MSSFDEKAATWDDQAKTKRAHVVAAAIRRAVNPTGATRVLEYGAGTGLVSQELAGSVGPLTLADPSKGMREVMHSKLATGALPASSRIWDLDLSAGRIPDERFDLVVTVMTLHHIPDLTPVLDGFARLLDSGGHLCVVDLVKEDGSFHHDGDFHGHHGFDTQDLSTKLESAGFTDVHVEQVYEVVKDGATYPLFLATCTKVGCEAPSS
ncbi:class I SAM-dependent methyltransferase [Amycolatopsis taiwanensis]|uniref:class I SAM-dependent methyltransferase n=1 Tax=Amycolatopsis taiwanensis TaxID=342230 RepID=UPI000481F3EB|nr:class I SAM-dependent methyltransferase [Amycolatopsis taiwanensis]